MYWLVIATVFVAASVGNSIRVLWKDIYAINSNLNRFVSDPGSIHQIITKGPDSDGYATLFIQDVSGNEYQVSRFVDLDRAVNYLKTALGSEEAYENLHRFQSA